MFRPAHLLTFQYKLRRGAAAIIRLLPLPSPSACLLSSSSLSPSRRACACRAICALTPSLRSWLGEGKCRLAHFSRGSRVCEGSVVRQKTSPKRVASACSRAAPSTRVSSERGAASPLMSAGRWARRDGLSVRHRGLSSGRAMVDVDLVLSGGLAERERERD